MGRVLSVLVNIERGPDRVYPEVVNRTTWTDGASQCPHTATASRVARQLVPAPLPGYCSCPLAVMLPPVTPISRVGGAADHPSRSRYVPGPGPADGCGLAGVGKALVGAGLSGVACKRPMAATAPMQDRPTRRPRTDGDLPAPGRAAPHSGPAPATPRTGELRGHVCRRRLRIPHVRPPVPSLSGDVPCAVLHGVGQAAGAWSAGPTLARTSSLAASLLGRQRRAWVVACDDRVDVWSSGGWPSKAYPSEEVR
jgi:hypothetical protein